MSDGIWIGMRPTTDEERQQLENGTYGIDSSRSYEDADQNVGYYDGQMGDVPQDAGGQFPSAEASGEPSPEAEPAPSTLWIAQPANLMDVWSKYDQDPEYVDEHYTKEQADTLYDYMSYKNQGKPVDQWTPLMDNDPFVTDVIVRDNWWEPAPEGGDSPVNGQSPEAPAYNPTDPELRGFVEQRPMGDWNNLDWIEKGVASLSTTDPGLNAPDYTRYTQAGMKATSSAMAGPAALKILGSAIGLLGGGGAAAVLTNPWVLAGTALGVGGLTFYQAVTGKEIPVFNKFLELSDIVDTTVEHSIGFGRQAYEIGKRNIQRANEDKNDAYGLMQAIEDTLQDVRQNASAMWKAGEYTYEMYGSFGDFAVDALKEIFKGEKGTKEGEGYFFNRGLSGKQELAPGSYGYEGITNIRKMYQQMDEMGIDKDMQDAYMQQFVINASGSSGNVSDYTMQMALDFDILAAPLENTSMSVLSRVTGNDLGVEAAKANSGSVLTQLPFVGSIYQAVSGKKAPGGFMEWIDQYRNLARSADVSTLSPVDRFFGGIDADGKIKDFARTEKTGMTDMLPEAKVAGVGNIAQNTMNAYFNGVQDVTDIRQRLAAMAGDAEAAGNMPAGFANSADVLTVRDGLKAAIAKSDPEIFIRQYENSEGARATLSLAAEQLGMEVKDMLSLYAETPAVFEQRVRNYAAEHNGMFAGIDVSNGVDTVSTIVQGFTTAKEGKGSPLAWDIRQLQYQITTSLIDGMAEYYVDYYGVKPNSTINTIFDTMKSAQSLLLLGWSPSYFINNVINNTVTAAAEGVLGFMTPKQIRTWMEAFGVTPARMDIDESAAFRGVSTSGKGGLETFTSKAADAKKTKGALNEINNVLKQANDKLGLFSRLSGLMETRQGNQLTTVAIQQYWRQRWKRGEGFHLMPDALVEVIEAQTPGMTNVIYQAIENGLNMDQVKKVLFADYVKPDAGTVMKSVVSDLFRGEAMVYEEVFEKSGVMNELRERIANCKTEEERETVIEDCRKKLDDYIQNLRREDLIQRANNVATVVESEGLAPVAQMMSEMEMNHQEFWLRIRREWTEIKQKIRDEKIMGASAQVIQAELVAKHDKEWADLYKQEAATVTGILKGLGFENETHTKYIGLMLENQKNWTDFNREKGLELKRFFDRRRGIMETMGIHKDDRAIMIAEAWEDYNLAAAELYGQHFDRETEIQTKMDAVFVEGYEHSTGKSGDQFRKNFQRIRDIRQQMYEMQQDAHNKTKDMTKDEQAEFYEEFNPVYNKLIRDIGNLGDANSKIIEDASAEGPGFQEHAETKLTPEQTVQATEVMEVNNAEREKAMRERKGYLDREGIKQGWIDAGRTPAEADLMMAVFDSAAESWAIQNGAYPDEFYSMAAQLKGVASWLPVGETKVTLNDAAGNLYQVDMVSPADINTDNFRNWFRDSKIVDENGNPLIVYHGTAESFDTFKKQKANDKLGRNMGLGLGKNKFYLTTERGAGEAFARSAESLGRGKNPQVMELYVSIQNPIAQAEYESRLRQKYLQYEKSDPRQAGYDYKQRDKAIAALDKEIRAEGYDGIWDQESGQIAVFEPTQIKSIYNSGEWSRYDANILHQTAAEYVAKYFPIIREHYGNKNFREWFGDSKVVDQYGLPLVVFHGTPIGGFETFEGNINWFTPDKEYAGRYTNEFADEPAIYECFIHAENILDLGDCSEEAIRYDDNGNEKPSRGLLRIAFEVGCSPRELLKIAKDNYSDTLWQVVNTKEFAEIAKSKGYDCISETEYGRKTYGVFDSTQIKSIENDGTFNKLDPNILHQQAVDKVKGTFEHTDVGNIIRMLEASDVSTMVHESGHLFRRTLSTPLLTEFTTWAGFDSVADFQELEARWQRNDPTLTEAERQRYVDTEEKFARGFEQYLMDGSAPTPGLKAVFKAFRDYLLDIYTKVKATVTGNDYSGQGEFVFHGQTGDEVLNINAEINGVKLRDIFDRMMTDDVQRIPGYTELVQNLRTQLGQDRHNMRMSDKALSRRAQVEVTRTILQNFRSLEEAESALANYSLPMEINGWRVDDGTLFEAINAAKADATMNPFAQAEWHEVKGTNTYAHSNKGSGRYQMQYKVVELSDLQPSNVWFGDQLVINEDYPADVQARNRTADQSDVYAHAVNLDPGKLIDEMKSIDRGAPIVGEGNLFVESGNGRVLSMLYAQEHFPEQWANYQEYLRNSVGDYGIDPAQLDSFENPVLIRERLGGNRIDFAEDANTDTSKGMTASENALTDANRMSMVTLSNLDIVPGEGTDTFDTEKNAQITVEWLRNLPESERAQYSTTNRNGDLVLSADGKTRFINALFATLYATQESMDIIKSFSETSDSNITALESALKQSLPEMARAEGLIKSGSRAESLSITADIMAAAGLLNEAREAGLNIHDYLAQQTIPGLERWTPTQALLAGFFGDAKNNVKKMRDFFNAYGEEVYAAGDPNQLSLFTETRTREQMIDAALEKALGVKKEETSGGVPANAGGQSPSVTVPGNVTGNVPETEGPALFQSVMDSTEKWSSEFAKTLDENRQRTFDDGLSMPLEQAETVYLRGELNVKYDTMVQRLLRDFSNDKNLSADQYLYALGYMEWWVQGSEGEAPQGNPLWEKQIQQMVMKDFNQVHPQEVAELMRRYKKGAEVDPDTAVPSSGEYFKRTYEFTHGVWNIAGNVYKDGKLVAYLPEEMDLLKKTIEVDGQHYKVLGVDMRNPEGLVYWDPVLEIVRTVNVGKPEGYDAPRNPFMFIKPAHQGSTPQTMPVADAYSELSSKYLMPALDAFGEAYTNADTDAKTAKMSGLNTQTRAQILQWLDDDVANDMRQEKYRAVKYSDMKKDAAMLNYNQRYGFDPLLTMLSPYQFWYTRSMWKWAMRMIDKPALGNAYQRMKEYEDKNRQENLPSRLAGKFRIAMPFLPDWMGGSYYIDLMSQLYPFSQFGQSYGSNMNAATLRARAEEILEQQVQQGFITAEDKVKAIADKKGAIWEDAYAQAELEVGQSDGLSTLASQFISPNIFYTWWQAKQAGEDPGTLNSTRTGNAIRAVTSDIPLVSKLGSVVGDAMSLPEKALRKLYGFDFDEFGAYGDQQIRKQISQMAADGEIDWRKALNAMNEKSGVIWDMAADRQRKEAMLKVPGFAGAEAAKQFVAGNASLPQALGSMVMSMAGGGSIYPEGEKTLREMKALRDQAYIDEANGKTGAVSEWYDKYGDLYLTRTATYMDDPEELMKFTLYNQITQKYYDQPYAQQIQIQKDLGPEFYYALFNKDTKNYEAVPTQKLAEWNAALGGTNPNVGSIDVEGVTRVMQLSQPVINAQEEHDRIKEERFPGIGTIQDIYYSLPKDQKKDFIAQFPQLEDYWEWNRQFKADHPEYVQWEQDRSDVFNERTMYLSYGDMSQRTQQELEYSAATGKDISDFANQELGRLYRKHANPSFMTYEEYVEGLKKWK